MKNTCNAVLKVLAVALPMALLSACMTSPSDTENVDTGGNNSGGNADGGNNGGGQIPVGLNCSSSGSFDACAEVRRMGALTKSFNQLLSITYGLRYTKSSAVANGAQLACPDGGTYSAVLAAANAVRVNYTNCGAPVGVLSGSVTVTRGVVSSINIDNDVMSYDLVMDGIRYVGSVGASHYATGQKIVNFGLKSTMTVTPTDGAALTITSFGADLTEQADGSFRDAGGLSLVFRNAAGGAMTIQGAPKPSFFKTETGNSGLFLSFDAPDDGGLTYSRAIPGVVTVMGNIVANGDQFAAQLNVGGTQLPASGAWAAAEDAALYNLQ